MSNWLRARLVARGKLLRRVFIFMPILAAISMLVYMYSFHWQEIKKKPIMDHTVIRRLRPKVSDSIKVPGENQAKEEIKSPETEEIYAGTDPKPILIFDWTGYFGDSLVSHHNLNNCPHLNCKLINNLSLFDESRAVIFHARDINWSYVPEERHPWQYYVFFSLESPAYANMLMNDQRKNFFNLTMSYRQDSDVQITYGHFRKKKHEGRQLNLSSIIERKSRMVAWFASNCQTASGREYYVNALKRAGISVDIYGSCTDDHRLHCPRSLQSACDRLLFEKYKFYLSFENSLCNDYITEKFYDRIKNYVVPIVMERRNYDNVETFPPRSFISVDDYRSMEDMARHLTYLDAHDDEYGKYLKWHQEYEIAQCPKFKGGCGFCDLCRYLGRLSRKHTEPKIVDIRKWWHDMGGCHQMPVALIREYARDDAKTGFVELAVVFIAVGLMFLGVLFMAVVAAFRCFSD